jgi:hypothetical protein
VSFASVLILSVLLFVLSHFLTYWELAPTFLLERKLWKKKQIAWQDVTRISAPGFSSDKVKISFGRVPENCSYIIANPSSRNKFIAALRRFAPNADCDVSPDPTLICKAKKRSDK